ncbi:MAG: ECF transporter S component [Candidatus Thorarchaeota archaeon]
MIDGSRSPITTQEIVTLAILGSLGGALSTFVGYLGNLINLSLGVPFGAGQFLAGLHVFWLVLMRVIVPRTGAGTTGGLLKGLVEMFTGSTHGIIIVIISLAQGLLIDAGAELGGDLETGGTGLRLTWWLSAGIASASNVVVFQALYFAGIPIVYIFVITILAFCSGVIFAGYFAWQTLEFLNDAGLVRQTFLRSSPVIHSKVKILRRNLPALAFVLFLIIGPLYYTVTVARITSDFHSCEVRGLVEDPYVFKSSDFIGQEATIEAQLQGSYIQLPAANYTGILLGTVISTANPFPDASGVQIIARDGYSVNIDIVDIMADTSLLLTDVDDGLWLIAGNYDGATWVRMVSLLEIY